MNVIKPIKVQIKATTALIVDVLNKTYFKFPKKRSTHFDFKHSLNLKQEIKPSEAFDNKVFNLTLAANTISPYIILPNEIFSFWHIIGNPNNAYKKGRTIMNGVLKEEIGGGLCQVSGIIYNASLRAGLEVVERYNHSMDIYTDETRFTPLGTDATVVYGYKDLRIKNNFGCPIKFQIEVKDKTISINLLSTERLEERKMIFENEWKNDCIWVKVKDEHNNVLNQSRYKKLVVNA